MPKNASIIPVLMILVAASLTMRSAELYAGVTDFLKKPAFAADKKADEEEHAKEEKADEKSEEEHKENAENAEVAQEEFPEAKDDEGFNKWRDSNDEDFGYNSVKMEHIQELEKRRQELEKQARNLQTREALLQAAQQEMDRKSQEMIQLRKKIESLLEEQSEEETARINSLVKIYEGMKAKQAAEIFNTLDTDILLQVFSKMSERKASPILAAMSPERARTITIMLAEQKKLPTLPSNTRPAR